MTKTWCVGGRHYSESINLNVYEKLNPKTKKLVKIIKSRCSICGRNKSHSFTK